MTHVRHMSRREALVAAGGFLALALGGCASAADDEAPAGETVPGPVEDPTDLPAEQPVASLDDQVEDALSALTLEEKVWQLFVVRPEALTGVGTQTAAGGPRAPRSPSARWEASATSGQTSWMRTRRARCSPTRSGTPRS